MLRKELLKPFHLVPYPARFAETGFTSYDGPDTNEHNIKPCTKFCVEKSVCDSKPSLGSLCFTPHSKNDTLIRRKLAGQAV